MSTVSAIGENRLVQLLTEKLAQREDVVKGVGDDCAVVLPAPRGWLQLLKTDCVVEGVHFLREHAPEQVGWKAMARAVSDIASMAGEPQHALVTLVLPPDTEVTWVERLYEGLQRCARLFDVALVGGETSSGSQLVISVSLAGRVKTTRCARRDGAREGDAIMVTGRLGGSQGGHHLTFIPRLSEAEWLAENARIHAMMDISDGLAKDLPRMASASGVEFVLEEHAIPAHVGCTREQAWSDGEDYELLIAVPLRAARRLESAWSRKFPETPLTSIGRFVPVGHGVKPSFSGHGWDHFEKA
jgi:thiamine-monophosphate kinase